MKKIVFIALAAVLLIGIAVASFFYFGNYSSGIRSGVVVKLSKKGFLFKTYEGQMNIGTFGAFKNDNNQLSTVFDFSVPPDREAVVKELEAVSLTGERINLHYEEKFFKYFWLGDTKYLITKVERLPALPQPSPQAAQPQVPAAPVNPPLPPSEK